MRDSKNLAMMFLLGAFLTGGVLGFTANGFMHRDRVCFTGSAGSAMMNIFSQRLQLTPEQERSFNAILDDRNRQIQVALEPVRTRLDSIKGNARDQMRRTLDEGQKREFEELVKEMTETPNRRE